MHRSRHRRLLRHPATPIPGCLPACVTGQLTVPGNLPAGEYTTQHFFGEQLTVTLPEGWTSFEDSTGEFGLRPLEIEGTALIFWLDVYPIVDDGTGTPSRVSSQPRTGCSPGSRQTRISRSSSGPMPPWRPDRPRARPRQIGRSREHRSWVPCRGTAVRWTLQLSGMGWRLLQRRWAIPPAPHRSPMQPGAVRST